MNFWKIKKKILVFHSVFWWSRRCGLIQPPRTQATSRNLALLGLRKVLHNQSDIYLDQKRKREFHFPELSLSINQSNMVQTDQLHYLRTIYLTFSAYLSGLWAPLLRDILVRVPEDPFVENPFIWRLASVFTLFKRNLQNLPAGSKI